MAFPTETPLITSGTRDADLAARPAWDLADQSEGLGADLIVAGSRGLSGIKRSRMGSVSESIVRHAYYQVLGMRHH
jgi:hypothetical protein